jgi:predicted oxidoreductase
MARELHTFGSPEEITAYLLAETGKTPEQIAQTVGWAIEDGIVLLDNGRIFGARAWEITHDHGIFRVVHEFGYLTADGEIV